MNTETVANVLHLGDNKPYPSDQRFIYRINFAVITNKNVKVQHTPGSHRPPDQ